MKSDDAASSVLSEENIARDGEWQLPGAKIGIVDDLADSGFVKGSIDLGEYNAAGGFENFPTSDGNDDGCCGKHAGRAQERMPVRAHYFVKFGALNCVAELRVSGGIRGGVPVG